jgi:deazaflavin-dependent oxidoreductase (nitroreductase family)
MGLPEERPEGLDSPFTAKAIKWMARGQVAAFRLTHGRVGRYWRIGAGWKKPVPTLLLDHVGRKSGRRFTTPLLYLGREDDVVVVASQGGLPNNPQWYANLLANPETTVHLPREGRVRVRAREAVGEERAALWPELVDLYADFAKYQRWTERQIPVVVLELLDR